MPDHDSTGKTAPDLPTRLRALANLESAALSPRVSPIGYAAAEAADEIERLRAVSDAARDLCATRTSELSPYIKAQCDAIRAALGKLDAG